MYAEGSRMDLRPTCTQCKCVLDAANIRTLPDSEGFVCRTCLEGKTGNKSLSSSSDVHSHEVFSKKSYLCEDCGYTFERNATFIVADCPMCAKVHVHEVIVEAQTESVKEAADDVEWLYE